MSSYLSPAKGCLSTRLLSHAAICVWVSPGSPLARQCWTRRPREVLLRVVQYTRVHCAGLSETENA